MGGGDSLVWAPGVASAVAESFSSVQLAEAPILLLVYFHKAFREELSEVRRVLLVASESGSYSRDLVLDLVGRFEFIKLAYKYHCAAEDEVVFLALDEHIKNVACTYSLEHRGIDDLFKSIFNCFTMLMESDENISKPFNELVFCIGTIQTAICKHMLKEEQQVFPLLMQQFSSKEQASLVWQFICSVPVALLEDIMPWMTSFLSPEEQVDILHCIREVVPKEKLLQEVVISWLGNKIRPFGVYTNIGKAAQCQPLNFKYLSKLYSVDSFSGHWKKASFLQKNFKGSPVDGLHLWHGAIRKDWKEILEELYQIQSSNDFSTLASVIVQLKFLAEVLLFYSNALEKTFYPVLNEISNGYLSLSYGRFPNENQIEGLQKSLFYNAQSGEPLCKFVEKLCRGLESFVEGIDEHLASQEMEIFPVISKNCSHEMQQQLLYMSLHMMPLGLLRCVVTWFSTHFSEDQTKSILQSIKQGGPLVDKSFASLLLEWVRIGYSGKTSIEKFRTDLQEMFKTKCYFVTDQIEEDTVSDSLLLDAQHGKRSQTGLMEANPANKAKDSESGSSSSGFHTAEKYDTLYSSGINMHIFFPRTAKLLCPFPRFSGEESGSASIDNLEPSPIDHIFFFHKALKNDLQYLLFGSSQLAENIGSFMDFRRRFHLVQFLYQIHSDAEDEIAFPALEAKGKNVENISHSYTIDHKLEVDLFNKISLILDEMSELHFSVTSVDTLDPRMLKYCQLCMKLHDMCKSLHKILCDHVHHEEAELWPLFRSYFSIKEQENIIGYMLGRTGSEILQEMIPWLMASLSPQEQQSIMFLWRKATKNTMFDEWLREWWEGMTEYDMAGIEDESDGPPSSITDPLEVVSAYLSKEGFSGARHETTIKITQIESAGAKVELSGNHSVDSKLKVLKEEKKRSNENEKKRSIMLSEDENKINNEVADVTDRIDKPGHRLKTSQVFSHQEQLLKMSQDELEAAIRRVSRDSSLGSQKKSYIMQNLLMSRWIVTQQKFHSEVTILSNVDGIPGQGPSYRDPIKLTFGCKHYKRNCKLLSACCNQLHTCRYCHDNVADHSMDRKATTKMMCMKCLVIQPVGPTCSTASCNNLSMAKYYCRICKFFDDEREIYHCPYCNLCRLGKGLGIDYFHCMNCNACMSRSLSVHICREKCFEDNCPICHEYIFTSSAPVKALSCGHLMHSACFQEYTCTHYTCPICSKSLGDMQVYFGMLDALLAEEKISDEYSGQTQDLQEILCNDCEKKGTAPFHWLYHKCSYCGSYNTRLL